VSTLTDGFFGGYGDVRYALPLRTIIVAVFHFRVESGIPLTITELAEADR
jgi:hypothetical protein